MPEDNERIGIARVDDPNAGLRGASGDGQFVPRHVAEANHGGRYDIMPTEFTHTLHDNYAVGFGVSDRRGAPGGNGPLLCRMIRSAIRDPAFAIPRVFHFLN